MSLENILRLDKKLMIKYKQVFLILKTSFKFPLKILYLVKEDRNNNLGCMVMDSKIAPQESYGKTHRKNEHNITEYDISR